MGWKEGSLEAAIHFKKGAEEERGDGRKGWAREAMNMLKGRGGG